MKNYPVEEIKEFMNELLINERYDSFYMYEVRIKTALDYYISGKRNMEFYENDDTELMEASDDRTEYVCWKDIKHTVFDLIKGKRLPISFKVILMFNRENIVRLVEMNNLPLRPEDITGLFMNIYYENGELLVTTGTSLKVFTLDKTLENLWDETVGKYYI